MNNVAIIEEILTKNEAWKEEFIGIFTHDLYDMVIDTNSGGLEIRDASDNRVGYMAESEAEASIIEASNFIQGFIHSTAYRADCPF